MIDESFLIGFVGGMVLSGGAKEMIEYIQSFDFYMKLLLLASLNEPHIPEVLTAQAHAITPNDLLTEEILMIIENTRAWGGSGVTVFGAPIGYGKSTYMEDAVMRARKLDPSVRVEIFGGDNTPGDGASLLINEGLYEELGIPVHCRRYRSISEFIPNGTVIIIDQINDVSDGFNGSYPSAYDFIVELATDSRNSQKYSVIVCVSNPETYHEILLHNGGEKIQPLFFTGLMKNMKWTIQQMEQLIAERLSLWSETDRAMILDICAPAYSPRVLSNPINAIEIFFLCQC